MTRRPKVGEHVIYCDPKGIDHNALVTVDWGGCINVVYVSPDETKQDQYGRQIERNATSVVDGDSSSAAHGRYWRFTDDERREYHAPIST
jgi:hypothetical protein